MNKNCGSVKNPCKICFEKVTTKTGLQCQGACRKWSHFCCLNYTPGKIQDIQKGFIKVLCPCPGCDKTDKVKEVVCKEELFIDGSCENNDCPSNSPPVCTFKECSSSKGLGPPCPHCPVQKQMTQSPAKTTPTIPKCTPAEEKVIMKATCPNKDAQNLPPKKTQSCLCATTNKPSEGAAEPRAQTAGSQGGRGPKGSNNQTNSRFSLLISGLGWADKDIQSTPSQRSQSCTCTMTIQAVESRCEAEPGELSQTLSDDAVRGTLVQLGATVGQLAAQVEELMTQIHQP